MLNQCSWCQSEIDFPEEIQFLSEHNSNYLCAECIIPLLPNSLTASEDEELDNENTENEQRNAIRLPMMSRVYLSIADQTSHVTKVLLLNFSNSGFKFQTDEAMNKEERITLGFLGGKISYKAIGTVVHTHEIQLDGNKFYEVGTKLIGIHMDYR